MAILSLGNKALLELFCLFRIACYTYCNPNFQSLTTPETTELKIHHLSNTYPQLPDKEQPVRKPLYKKHPIYLKIKPQTIQASFSNSPAPQTGNIQIDWLINCSLPTLNLRAAFLSNTLPPLRCVSCHLWERTQLYVLASQYSKQGVFLIDHALISCEQSVATYWRQTLRNMFQLHGTRKKYFHSW